MSLRDRVAALFHRRAATSPLDLDPEGMSEDPAVRRAYLTRSMDETLEEVAQAGGFGPAERVAWVAEHVEIYAGRCVGVAAHAGGDTVRGSGFLTMVEIGTDALRRELAASPPPSAGDAAWRAFLAQLAATRDGAEFESLEAAARALRVALGGRDPWRSRRL